MARASAGRQALLVVAHLRKGETYTDVAAGFWVATSTVDGYLREALDLLAAMAPTLAQPIEVAHGKAYVTLNGTLLRIDGIADAGVRAVADTDYQGGGPAVRVLRRRRRPDPDTGCYRRLSANEKDVNTAHARQRRPAERANAELKNWKILREIRASPSRATTLVNAVQTLIIAS